MGAWDGKDRGVEEGEGAGLFMVIEKSLSRGAGFYFPETVSEETEVCPHPYW